MPLQPPEPYLPRRIAPQGLWSDDERTLKAYAIQRDPDASSPMLADVVATAARAAALQVLREQAGPRDHDLGYVIVHVGEEAVWLLVDWWITGGIVCQRMLSAPLARPTQFEPVAAPALACVWELAVIAHERDAWIRHMLREAPDAQGYLDDQMAPASL